MQIGMTAKYGFGIRLLKWISNILNVSQHTMKKESSI